MEGLSYVEITGPVLIGSLLSYYLNGAFTMQLYHYYMNFAATDRKPIVYMVAFVTSLEMLQIGFSTHSTYTMLAAGFARPSGLELVNSPLSGASGPAINGAVGFCVQIFFAWRILTLTQNVAGKAAAGLIALTAGTQMAASFGTTIEYAMVKYATPDRYLQLYTMVHATVTVALAGAFTCDILITSTMVVTLMRARGSTSISSSKNLINALIVHTIENGMITTVCAVCELGLYLGYPTNWYSIVFGSIMGRLYANVMLASLNGRQRMRATGTLNGPELPKISAFAATSNLSARTTTNQIQIHGLCSGSELDQSQSHQQSGITPSTGNSIPTDVEKCSGGQ